MAGKTMAAFLDCCPQCGENFLSPARRPTTYCSKSCAKKHAGSLRRGPTIFDDNGTVAIPLTQGQYAFVDEADYWSFKELQDNWRFQRNPTRTTGYATRADTGIHLLMHRLIMNAPDDLLVDHKDGDGLNNRRDNLRLATSSQNSANQAKQRSRLGSKPTSQYKGLYYDPRHKNWSVQLGVKSERKNAGPFLCEEEAARAYDILAREHFGEFARLNFPD